MKSIMELLSNFTLLEYNTAITREAFEAAFYKTKEKITFTFDGWDGKSYNGETRTATVYRTNIPGFEDLRLIKVGAHLHYIMEDWDILEEATGKYHNCASWVVEVLPRTK